MAQTNNDYRKYLINNANKLMQTNFINACQHSCGCTYTSENMVTNNKYIYKSYADKSMPYGYEQSDLKDNYINRQTREIEKSSAPIIKVEQYLKE